MESMDIAFPNLGLYLHNVPKSISVFGFEIALYGIMIGIGAIAGFYLSLHVSKKDKLDTEYLWDCIVFGLIAGIIGARIYYVIFAWEYYKDDLWQIFNIRNGGLAIYGGVIAATLEIYIFTRIKKISFTRFMDIVVPGITLGQIIGRWGNFFNREVFGTYTDNLLAMRIPYMCPYLRTRDIDESIYSGLVESGMEYIQVHPTFLYEGMLNLILLIGMLLYRKHKKFNGEILLLYLGGYGIIRAFVEGIRTDRLLIAGTGIAVSQILGVALFVFALIADIFVRIKIKKNAAVEKAEENTEEERNEINEEN